MEFIRFLNLEASYAEEFNELDIFLHGVRSLPSTLTELTVSLCFCDIYEDHQNYISQIDSVLGTSSGVKMVEVIPGVRGDQEKMRAGFPKLMSQNRLDVKAGWSEAEQIFST